MAPDMLLNKETKLYVYIYIYIYILGERERERVCVFHDC